MLSTQRAQERTAGRTDVLKALTARGPLSQPDLVRIAALAPSTVSGIVAQLRAEGTVSQWNGGAKVAPGPKGGRPGTIWALQPSVGVVAGIDFGKKHVRVALADLAHTILSVRSAPLVPDAPASSHIARASALLDEVLAEAGLKKDAVLNVGVGIPGPLRPANRQRVNSSILPGWAGVEVSGAVSSALDLPAHVANDADLGALSEWMWGSARGRENVVYLKASSGIGAGLILSGNPYGGAGGTAGEIGHVPVDPQGRMCRCGNQGCLETVAGTGALLENLETLDPRLTVDRLVQRALLGESAYVESLSAAGHAIGIALAMLCNLINPERIVVGGELAAAGDLLLAPMRAALRQAALESAVDDVTVVESELQGRAEVLGAVALALRTAVPSPTPH